MRTYRHLKVFIAGFFAFYVGLGAFIRFVLGHPTETFPISLWCIYCRIPSEVHDYALRILAVNGEELALAPYFQEAGQWFQGANSLAAYAGIQELGLTIAIGDAVRIAQMRRSFEPLYLGRANVVRYEVVKRSFNPIERWKYGSFKSVTSLGVLESSRREQ